MIRPATIECQELTGKDSEDEKSTILLQLNDTQTKMASCGWVAGREIASGFNDHSEFPANIALEAFQSPPLTVPQAELAVVCFELGLQPIDGFGSNDHVPQAQRPQRRQPGDRVE